MKKYLITIILISSIFGQSFKDLTERPTYNPIKIDQANNFDGVVDDLEEWSMSSSCNKF